MAETSVYCGNPECKRAGEAMELVETKDVPIRVHGEKVEFIEAWKCRGCERTVFLAVNRRKPDANP